MLSTRHYLSCYILSEWLRRCVTLFNRKLLKYAAWVSIRPGISYLSALVIQRVRFIIPVFRSSKSLHFSARNHVEPAWTYLCPQVTGRWTPICRKWDADNGTATWNLYWLEWVVVQRALQYMISISEISHVKCWLSAVLTLRWCLHYQ